MYNYIGINEFGVSEDVYGVQSEVLFTGDVARRREYRCQVNEVYMHLIERCDFITEWKKTLLSSLT